MQKKIRKRIALFLAALLFLSPFSETTLYAAPEETTASSETETEQNIESDIESKIETESEPEESDAGDGMESSAENDTESTAEIESETMLSESMHEIIPEGETESVSENTFENAFEDTSESISEAASEIEYSCPAVLEPENAPYDENLEEFTKKLVGGTRTRSELPAKYDAREEGYLPAIRNQGGWGACWCFSLLGAMEVSMVRDMGALTDEVDLSERHLAYFGFNTGYDALDNANGDTMTSPASYYLDNGGNDRRGIIRLMNWNGGAQESDYPYPPTSTLPDALERTVAQDAGVYLENAYGYNFAEAIKKKINNVTVDEVDPENKSNAIKVVKKMIIDYGAVSWSFWHKEKYFSADDRSYYNYEGGGSSAKTNHAVMVVGWDDNYAKENFKSGAQPENDGAWIIRNSWGKSRGEDGYMYISYEDVSLGSGNSVYAVTACDSSKYDNNYFYGNTAYSTKTIAVRRAAQVYQMKSPYALREKLTAVSFLIGTSDVDYELQIYKNPDMTDGIVTNPTSGTPMLDTPQTGTLGYAGFHTIALEEPIVFEADDYVSVVLTFPKTKPSMYFDRSDTSDDGLQKGVHVITEGQSFYGKSLTSWEDDYANNRTFRINALTVDCEDALKTPDAPEIDKIEYNDERQVALTWSGAAGADRIKIYRREDSADQGELIANVSAEETSYIDSVHKGKAYYYTLIPIMFGRKGRQIEGQSVQSEQIVTFPETTALDAAQYIEETGVRLVWNAARGADGYLIERSDNDGSFWALAVVEDGTAQTYTDETAERGNSYKYRIMSYFLAEDESQNPMPVQNERKVEIAPKPVMFSQITELKRESGDVQNGTARVSLSWDAAENAQSYAIYRRVALEEGADSYMCIAQNLTQEQYIDSTARPDTTYSYKLIVTVNGLDSELEQTQDKTITTKPVLTALKLSVENAEILKGKETAFQITPSPAHYPYAKEIVWSACDEKGNELLVTQKNDTTVIKGKDGKEILLISENQIHAVQDSETVRVTLTAAIDEIHAQCAVFVYSNNFWVRGKKDLTYTGAAVTQKLDVYDGKFLLTEGVDYTVTYKNNVKVSANETNKSKKPQVIVKGKGSYTGTQIIYFEILPEAAEDVNRISVLKAKVSSIKTLAYQGQALEPKPVVKYGKNTLAEGVDYTLSYENNNRAGTAVVLVNGINDYKGTKRVNFKINYNLQTDSGGLMSVKLDTVDVPYVKGGAKPILEVRCGSRLLKEGTDYKLSYKNNRAIAGVSDQKAPTIIITGKGSYQGKKEVSFNIVPQDIGGLTLTAKDKVYTEKAGNFTTSFVITDKDGKKLSAGKDYDKTSVKYTYADTGIPVMSTDTVPRGTTLRITVNAADSSAYSGTISGEYRIASYDIAKAKVRVEAQTYTGEPITPHVGTGVAISYKGYGRELAEGVHYDITGYDNNVRKGTATLYIQGKGDFSGTKTVKFKIKTRTFKWWWE